MEAEPLTWADARDRCEQLGGHLAVIESEAENQFVFELAEGKTQRVPNDRSCEHVVLAITCCMCPLQDLWRKS